MSSVEKHTAEANQSAKQQIKQEVDAEFTFGRMLESAGQDVDAFMSACSSNQHQFNHISHYLYGLTDDLSLLPPAVAVLLMVSRQQRPLAQIEPLTYAQLERLLSALGYHQVPSQPGSRFFVNQEYDAVSVLPVAEGEEPARPHHLMTLRRIATEKGIVDEETFDKLLNQARQYSLNPLAKASE